MSDPVYSWWLDDRGNPWVKHECRYGDWELIAWRLPPPWHVEGDGIVPSLNCTRCGAHQFIGPAERAPHRLWNWELPIDDLCTVCDGKPEPDPECEWCHGTGLDKEGVDDGPSEPTGRRLRSRAGRCRAGQGAWLFTVPIKWADEPHPLGVGPDDLIRVHAPTETAARLLINEHLGPDRWCSVHVEPVTDEWRRRYYPGRIVDWAPEQVTS